MGTKIEKIPQTTYSFLYKKHFYKITKYYINNTVGYANYT